VTVDNQKEYLLEANTSIDQEIRSPFASTFTNPKNVAQMLDRSLRETCLVSLAINLEPKQSPLPVARIVEGVENERGEHSLAVLLWVSQEDLDRISPKLDTSMCFTVGGNGILTRRN
jgi:hypothetical protein